MPGVVRVFTAADVPGFRGHGPQRSRSAGVRRRRRAHLLRRRLPRDGRRRHAVPRAPGRRRRFEVDYEVLEPLTDPFEALKPGAPLVHPSDTFAPRQSNILQPITAFSRGDVDAALADGRARHRSDVSRRSRSRSHSSSPKRASSCRRATASRCTPTARDRSTTTSRSPRC